MGTEKINIAIKIFGDVKESGIRFSAMHQAYKSGVKGMARYTDDGAVYIEAEGNEDQLEGFKLWCLCIAEKYDHAKTEISNQKLKGYSEFNIID